MSRDDSAYLLDMLLAARDALAFAEGMSYDEFAQDRRTQFSLMKAVEIVGEAAAHGAKAPGRRTRTSPGGRS